MTWLWQPLLPGGAQLLSNPVVNYEMTVDLGTYAITGNAVELVPAIVMAVDTGAYVVSGKDPDLEAVNFTAAQAQPGPADDRPARRRRDRQISEAYWAQRQREALEDQERKRLEALAEAEAALEDAENAKKADAKRKAVRRVFDALKRAAVTENARDDAQAAEQSALAAIAGRQTEQQRAVYLAALDQLNVEIEAIGAEISRLYARRRQDEEFLLRMWAS